MKVIKSRLPVEGRNSFPKFVYGLEGVMEIFRVSKSTASRYTRTILAPAVARQGRVMIVDVRKALKCFGVKNPSSYISK